MWAKLEKRVAWLFFCFRLLLIRARARFGENESLGLLFDIFSQVIQGLCISQPMMMKMHEEWRVFSDSIYLCSPEQSFFYDLRNMV